MRSIALTLMAILLAASLAQGDELVRVHRLPAKAKGPAVAVHGATVHLVWGAEGAIFHAQSTDGGRTFGETTRVSAEGEEAFAAMERGPRVAVAGDGTVHVVWSPPGLKGARYASRAPDAVATSFQARKGAKSGAEQTVELRVPVVVQ